MPTPKERPKTPAPRIPLGIQKIAIVIGISFFFFVLCNRYLKSAYDSVVLTILFFLLCKTFYLDRPPYYLWNLLIWVFRPKLFSGRSVPRRRLE